MRYSYEFKLKCVQLYENGQYPETPLGIKERNFRKKIREWYLMMSSAGPDALKHKTKNKKWTAEERYELVSQVMEGKSIRSVALSAGLSDGSLYSWVKKCKIEGYDGLENIKKGRPSKKHIMKKTQPLNESEREELLRLREENEYIKAENAVIKKQIALRHKKQAALLKAKRQQSLKNLEKKDIR